MAALLSPKLAELAQFFEKQEGNKPVSILPKQCALMAEQLKLMAQLTASMELELEAFRQLEANRMGRRFLEEEATDTLEKTVPADGNVFRPNFGRKQP